MGESGVTETWLVRLRRYLWALVALWTAIVVSVLLWNLLIERRATLEMARYQARFAFTKDLLYRRWNADHGGVYVPVSEDTPPNPYLSNIEERDITTPSGRLLTLINPAYMTRKVHELGAREYGLYGHITSLKPIRPGNAPDPWETEALRAFERGATEVSSVEELDGKAFMRLMRPLVTEQTCLKCHAAQGYKVGDIRGGISIAAPMEPLWTIARGNAARLALGHSMLWLLGLGGIGLAARDLKKHIGEGYRAREALRESEARYRTLAENSPVGIWQLTEDGNTIYANPAMCSMLEIEGPEKLTGRNYSSFLTPESLEITRREHARRREGIASSYEVEIVGKRGGRRNVVIYGAPIFTAKRKLQSLIGTFIDITGRKQAEEERRKLSSAVEQSPAIVLITDTRGNIEYVNPRFTQVSGYTLEEVFGKNLRVLKSGETSEQEYKQLWETITSGKEWKGEFRNRKKNGKLYWEEAIISSIKNEENRITHFLKVAEDITERKNLENQLLQAQKMEAVGRLAGGIAHDFNNLLTVITGYCNLLLDGLDDDSPLRNDLEEIKKAGNRATSLTGQLLAFSRKQVLQPKVLDLNALIGDMEKMLHRLIGEDIELATVLNKNPGRIKADPGQIEQVIMNLVINAKDSMPKGGKLTIETGNVYLDEEYSEQHVAVIPGNYIMLAITDTGTGMDRETLVKIFEPFFTTKEKDKGTGLGLSTVYGIVKQSGGYIFAYSEVSSGTTFKIYLPQWRETFEKGRQESASVETLKGSETVLLVEDEDSVRNLTRRVLRKHGYTVIEAAGGKQALEICREYPGEIHLLLTDVIMPRMGGKELSEELIRRYPDMKVLFVSGYTENAILNHGVLKEGINFLQKPFSPVVILKKVREVLHTRPLPES